MRNLFFLSVWIFFSVEATAQMKVFSNPDIIQRYHVQNDSRPRHKYTAKDVEATLPLINEMLKSKQFVPLTDEAFDQKIKIIFREVLAEGNFRVKHHGKFDILLRSKGVDEFNHYENNIVISREYKFISKFFPIGALIEFTDSAHYTLGTSWHANLIARNKYLLNDSKADLAILMNTDTIFLEDLVKKYGYTSDQRINDVVMREYANARYQSDILVVNNILFRKNSNGKLVIRKGLLEWIGAHATAEDHRLLDAIDHYALRLYSDTQTPEYEHHPKTYFTLNERREILAYISDVYIPVYKKLKAAGVGDLPAEPVLESVRNIDDPEIVNYYKSVQYFNLEHLKKEL